VSVVGAQDSKSAPAKAKDAKEAKAKDHKAKEPKATPSKGKAGAVATTPARAAPAEAPKSVSAARGAGAATRKAVDAIKKRARLPKVLPAAD